MNRPEDVEGLIGELREEFQNSHVPSTVAAQEDAKMVIITEDEDRFEFSGEECKLLLNSTASITRMAEALDDPDESCVELHGLTVDDDVRNRMELTFTTVDEM